MSLSETLVVMLSRREDELALAAAEMLEKTIGTQTSVLEFFKAPVPVTEWAAGVDGAVWGDVTVLANGAARAGGMRESEKLRRRLDQFARLVSIKRVQMCDGGSAHWAGLEARRASLSIMMRPSGLDESFRRAVFEGALYESGRPVLLMPPHHRIKTLGRTILIAWNGSREATRALADAEPFLAKAEVVFLVSVDSGGRGGLPGTDAAAYLRRNGLRCQQRSIPGSRNAVENLLIGECVTTGADMIVMGGYGHARLHEMLFGGVTRSLVRNSPVPLFISR